MQPYASICTFSAQTKNDQVFFMCKQKYLGKLQFTIAW